MGRKNPGIAQGRQCRKVMIESEEPIVQLCFTVVDLLYQDDPDEVRPELYRVVRRYTQAVLLREFAGLTLTHIGDLVGLSHSAVISGIKKVKTRFLHGQYGSLISDCIDLMERRTESY